MQKVAKVFEIRYLATESRCLQPAMYREHNEEYLPLEYKIVEAADEAEKQNAYDG